MAWAEKLVGGANRRNTAAHIWWAASPEVIQEARTLFLCLCQATDSSLIQQAAIFEPTMEFIFFMVLIVSFLSQWWGKKQPFRRQKHQSGPRLQTGDHLPWLAIQYKCKEIHMSKHTPREYWKLKMYQWVRSYISLCTLSGSTLFKYIHHICRFFNVFFLLLHHSVSLQFEHH